MSLKLLFLPFVVLALTLGVVACGDDDDDTGDDGAAPTATQAADDAGDDGDDSGDDGDDSGDDSDDSGDDDGGNGGGGGFGSGTATLTIGDQVYEIDGVGCIFSAEEAQNPDFPFNLSGFGEVDGHRAQLNADIYDPSGEERTEGEGVSHNISYVDIDDFENPTVDWTDVGGLLGSSETVLTIDGKHVSGTGVFDDGRTDEFEQIEGTLEVDCP